MTVQSWLSAARKYARHTTGSSEVLEELRQLRAEVVSLRKAVKSDFGGLRTQLLPSSKTCPLCLAQFAAFSEFRGRANARCPECGSFERHRLAWLYMCSSGLFRSPTRFLHFAPEQVMRSLIERDFNVAYTPAIHDPENPQQSIDIQCLPFAEGSFDALYCSHVLEHIPDDRLAIRELARVLRPGGIALVMIPVRNDSHTYEDANITSPEERAKHFGRWDHLRLYGRDVVDRLGEAGFGVDIVYHHQALSIEERIRYGVSNEPIFVCRKR